MKNSKILLLIAVSAFTAIIANGQTSCPAITSINVSNTGGDNYFATVGYNNPTSGAKSIKLKVIGASGICLEYCIKFNPGIGVHTSEIFNCTGGITTVTAVAYTGVDCNGSPCSTLPLVLNSISAQKDNDKVKIIFTIEPESIEESSKISVERSADGKNFSMAGLIYPDKNRKDYWFKDQRRHDDGETLYYRLKLEDATSLQYSKIVSVSFAQNSAIVIKPINGNLFVYRVPTGSVTKVIDGMGRTLLKSSETGNITLTLPQQRGVMIVAVDKKGERIFVQKFSVIN